MIDSRFEYIKHQIILDYETLQIFEEIAKFPRPRTTDTCYVTPDVLELVNERFFDWENPNEN